MKNIVPGTKQICKRFKQLRTEQGLTQPEYAVKLKLTREAVNSIERARYCPSVETIKRMKKVFGKSYDWILEGK